MVAIQLCVILVGVIVSKFANYGILYNLKKCYDLMNIRNTRN